MRLIYIIHQEKVPSLRELYALHWENNDQNADFLIFTSITRLSLVMKALYFAKEISI